MKTETKSIKNILSQDNSFFIPPFQRAYAWGINEVNRYFCDILKIVKSENDKNVSENDKQEHFFGTIVVKSENSGFGTKYIVVDGQQRLTTTLLFLIALRDSIKGQGESDEKNKKRIQNKFLCNEDSEFPDKIKLKQVTRDWESYRSLINGKETEAEGQIKIVYREFCRLISKENNVSLDNYITALGRLNVAIIFLDERPSKGEDPQIIFETLNSLGKPLTLSDLIRNYILLKLRSENQTKIYEELWYPKIEKIFGEETSKFFRDFLQYKKANVVKVISDNNTKEIYQQFKEFIESEYDDSQKFIYDIVEYVDPYKWILNEKNDQKISEIFNYDKEIKELLLNIFHDIKSDSFKPLVLGLLYYFKMGKIDEEVLIENLKIIRTYLIRRRILRLTQAENKNIPLQCKKLEKIFEKEISLWDILSNMFYKLRLPNDNEVRNELKNANFYEGLKSYSKFILGKMEENNSKVSVDFRDKKITIEHIMPQTLTEYWKKELGDKWKEIQDNYLHNIGNLILTEFNSEIGNRTFEEKKAKLMESNLRYRLDIIDLVNWDESKILMHQTKMIEDLLKTFPLPDKFKSNQNWKANDQKFVDNIVQIFPLSFDEDEATGTKPFSVRICGVDTKVKSWQDAYLCFLKFIKESKDYDFNILEENQERFFGKNDAIISSSKLNELEDIDKKKYKTIEGQFWNNGKNFTDVKFYHINFSANTCISRICEVMKQYGISDVIIFCK